MAANKSSRHKARGPRPHTWKCGPDEYRHSMYHPWQKMKAQAKFRGDDFDLSFEEFFNIWNGHWHERGRQADNLCLTRKDWGGPWDKDNSILVTRQEHLEAQGFYRQHQVGRIPRGKGIRK